jgi:ribosomal subunit interface protein
MSFQNIAFKHTHTEVDSRLDGYVVEKLNTLAKYVNADEARVAVEYEKLSAHRHGEVCRVEVNISSGKDYFRAVSTKETFDAAINLVRDELESEMDKNHKKRISLFRSGARKIKEMMRFGN